MRLSKSKINEYETCSWRFKLRNVDYKPEPRTPFAFYAEEGTAFHEGVVRYFAEIQPFKPWNERPTIEKIKQVMDCKDEYVENFISKFVQPILLKSCKNNPKYYFPVLMEQKIYNTEWNFSGIVDAVFVNPKDDEYVLMDWKTGKLKSVEEVKEELAYYKFLLDEDGKLSKPVKYGAIFFAKVGKLIFEELTDEDVEDVKNRIKQTREDIAEEKFEKNPDSCYFCGYSQRFGKECDGGK